MKSVLKYPGGKWRIADWIISHFPEHSVYLEPFFGSGAIFFKKSPAYTETINDIDGNIVNLFKVCREHPNELSAALNLTPFARDEFTDCYDMESGNPVERARKTVVRYHQSFGTSNSSKNSWKNTQTAGGPRCATMWNYLPATVIQCCERLKEAQIENIDAVELIKRYNDKDTLIYCDPPYLQDMRKKHIYKNEYTEEQHIELLEAITKSKSKVIISGYDNPLYNEHLSGWKSDEIKTTAQMGLYRVEKIWMNFDYQMNLSFYDAIEKE